jgi:hypothetical protein
LGVHREIDFLYDWFSAVSCRNAGDFHGIHAEIEISVGLFSSDFVTKIAFDSKKAGIAATAINAKA